MRGPVGRPIVSLTVHDSDHAGRSSSSVRARPSVGRDADALGFNSNERPNDLHGPFARRVGGWGREIAPTVSLSDPCCLATARLTLIPFSAELLELVLTDRQALEQRLGARFLPRWNWEGGAEYLDAARRAIQRDPSLRVWRIYFVLHNRDNAVIGDVGLKGPPDRDGSVEIHYGLEPAYQRHGYGFEAVEALVGWTFVQPRVRLITAVCDHDNVPSVRVLEKLRMRRVRVEGGSLWWRLSAGIAALERWGMRRTGQFLRKQLARSIHALERLGRRRIDVRGPSHVWHLSRDSWAEHREP
jgi:[ribosomal protein S5]-alanine N-acetyltransferase